MNEKASAAPSRTDIASSFFNKLYRYLNVLISKWWVLIACVACCVGAMLFLKLHAAPIRPILGLLSFTKDCPSWGYAFRFGLFEITKEDFEIIQQAMSSNV